MLKLKNILVLTFCIILFIGCENKKTAPDTSKGENSDNLKEEEDVKDITNLLKIKDQLHLLNLSEAINKYGEPEEKETIKIKKDNIPVELEVIIEKNYPNKEYETTNVEILEASWQLEDQSWIQVWYKLENKVWIPIDVLLTV